MKNKTKYIPVLCGSRGRFSLFVRLCWYNDRVTIEHINTDKIARDTDNITPTSTYPKELVFGEIVEFFFRAAATSFPSSLDTRDYTIITQSTRRDNISA